MKHLHLTIVLAWLVVTGLFVASVILPVVHHAQAVGGVL